MRRERIGIGDVLLNEGQIEGVPSNPRRIDEGRFESLCRSVRSLPEVFMMELSPHYCDVIIARWEKLTGEEAVKVYG